MPKKEILIIGGGIIGLCSAWYLHKAGHQITIIDKSETGNNCSTGNAGLIRPTHMIPLAKPGVISHALQDIPNPKGFFHLKPSARWSYIKFLLEFKRAASHKNYTKPAEALKSLLLLSKSLYLEILNELDINFFEKGLVVIGNQKNKSSLLKSSDLIASNGLGVQELDSKNTSKLTHLKLNPHHFGIHYTDDFHLDPENLILKMRSRLLNLGVKIIDHETLIDFRTNDKHIEEILTDKARYNCEELILSAGFQSSILLKKLGINLLMEPGKGYSLSWEDEQIQTDVPVILSGAHLAISKTPGKLRITGCMEVGDFSFKLNNRRIETIYNQARTFVPELDYLPLDKARLWCGHRPLSFDGLPYIGRSSHFHNLTIATGHSMSGMSMGAGTGYLLEQLISGQSHEMNIELFNPNR
ncbi:MAG: FAD-binding oxidoreductase [Bacteroidales bacterium]|nr:FAD-binding oxidoreductase [Bacteroidales bacterium]